MKKSILLCFLILIFTLSASAAEDGLVNYRALCSACHKLVPPPTIAPPLFGVKNNLLRTHPQREDFVNYIVNFVQRPDASKSVMPHAVQKFKLMPALPYPEEKVRAVAEFIFDTDLTSVQ